MIEQLFQFIGDWHTQTIAHGDNQPLLVDQTIKAAIAQRFKQFCITDHYPLPPNFIDPTKAQDCSMVSDMYFGIYLQTIKNSQRTYSEKIDVRRGAEFDWLPDYQQWTQEQINIQQFDFCIGSIHFLKDPKRKYWILDYTEDEFLKVVEAFGGIKNLVTAYYQEVRNMVQSGLFNSIGHIDLIKKYSAADKPLFSEQDEWYKNEVNRTLDLIAQSKMSMEINTSGLQKKCKSTYPSQWILDLANKKQIGLTIGSDAHKPEEIGRDLDKALNMSLLAGYNSINVYQKRQKIPISIK
ncbi:MAG: histidinol-phosphatase HisJ [bacterium]|nr:histidinol-phosphatase HisJ [bacterium]